MNLYRLNRTDPVRYDEYYGAVVRAESKDRARLIHPDGKSQWDAGRELWIRHRDDDQEIIDGTWTHVHNVEVHEIGTSLEKTEGVELDSFRES